MDFELERDQREFRVMGREGGDEIVEAHVEGPPRLLPQFSRWKIPLKFIKIIYMQLYAVFRQSSFVHGFHIRGGLTRWDGSE